MDIDTTYPINPDTLDRWDECCEAGRIAREQIDHWKWYIGDVANRVVILYPPRQIGGNDRTLAEFAREVNIPIESMYKYRRTALFYPFWTRVQFIESHPNLTWTHFRDAMSVGDVESAYEFLEECSAQGWTTDEAAYHISNRMATPSDSAGSVKKAPRRWQGLIVGLNGGNVTIKLKIDEYSEFEAFAKNAVEITIQELDT